jgi:hypothetical protein
LLEEEDPLTAPLSRNIYILNLVSSPDFLPRDSENSTGDVVPVAFGPSIYYIKVIGCSSTASNTTVVINGMNMPLRGTGVLPPSEAHPWFNMTPHPSRGLPYEDCFSALYSKLVTVKLKSGLLTDFDLSIFEAFYVGALSRQGYSLQVLEGWMRGVTVVYIATPAILKRGQDITELVAFLILRHF